MKKGRGGITSSDVIGRYIKKLYDKGIILISDHIYYSIILRGEYPYVAELFEGLAEQEAVAFRMLGEILVKLGIDPKPQLRARSGGVGNECRIERIISYEAEELRKYLSEIERAEGLCRDKDIYAKLEEIQKMMNEKLAWFERMRQS